LVSLLHHLGLNKVRQTCNLFDVGKEKVFIHKHKH